MPAPLSTHTPGLAGGDQLMPAAGVLTIDTGLRSLQSFVAGIKDASVANEEGHVRWAEAAAVAGKTARVTVTVTKGGTNHADAADTAVTISWIALGT